MPRVHLGDRSIVISENGSAEGAFEYLRRQQREDQDVGIIRNQKYFHLFDLFSQTCRLCGKDLHVIQDEWYNAENRGFQHVVKLICHRSVHSPYYYDLATSLVDGAGI